MEKRSIYDHFLEQTRSQGDAPAALVKHEGSYRPTSWNALAERAEAVAKALIAEGVQSGDRVAILMATRLEWVVIDLGIVGAGAVTVPIYPSSLPEECRYLIEDSDSWVVFAENEQQAAKFLEIRDRLPSLRRVIQLEGPVADDELIVGFDDFLAHGRDVEHQQFVDRIKSLDADDILTIIYTSGTTGRPKGVVLTHGNLLYEASCVHHVDLIRPDDVQLLFLPLAHSFAKLLEIAWLSSGHIMAFAEDMTTIGQNLMEAQPTVMCGVPRVFEKFYAAVEEAAQAPGVQGKLVRSALDLSRRRGELELEGRSLPPAAAFTFGLLRRTVLSTIGQKVQAKLGGRMRGMLSGGGPLPRAIAWLFRDIGIPIMEGYGLTETSAGTCVNQIDHYRLGTVGKPLPGTEIRLADDGEILIKGPGVMREYWKDPESSAEALQNGWFHTGDIGEFDRDGFLRITDRKKDLIVTAGGKNIAPQKIENMIKSKKLISHCVVHGDRRKFLSALITVDTTTAKELVRSDDGDSTRPLAKHPRIEAEIRAAIEECNATLPSYETIKKFAILDQDFSIENGELTPKLSVKRKIVFQRYREILDGFYEDQMLN